MARPVAVVQSFRRLESAAVAGIVFAVILGLIIWRLRGAAPDALTGGASWSRDPGRRDAVDLALALIPFAGIAFLWFIAVIRARIGSFEDRFFETVFLGSGLLFIALLFAAAASLKAVLVMLDAGVAVSTETSAFAWSLAASLLGSFGTRMAAVFIVSVATVGLRFGALPRWVSLLGYATGVILLLTPPLSNHTQFLFPAWILLVSVTILIRGREQARADARPVE